MTAVKAMNEELKPISLVESHAALRSGNVTVAGLLEAARQAYLESGSAGNAYMVWSADQLADTAAHLDGLLASGYDLGPLMGLPVSIKDMYNVSGYQTRAGTDKAIYEAREQPGPIVSAVMNQAPLLMGKTHTVELAFGGLGINRNWGTPINPWSPDGHRVPGGSSSGAGVSVITGTAALALGTDTAGSVRIPAAMTGTVGFKISVGRWPLDGVVPLSTTLDTPGLIARSVRDVAFAFEAIDNAIYRANPRLRYAEVNLADMTIGLPKDYFWDDNDPSIDACIQSGLRELERAGARLKDVDLPGLDECYALFQAGGLAAPELTSFLKERGVSAEELPATVRDRLADGETLPAYEYIRRRKFQRGLADDAAAIFEGVDCLVTPTVGRTPPKVSSLDDPAYYREANMLALKYTMVGNFLDLCGLSLPAGFDALGMPVGMQIYCGHGQDSKLLAQAAAIEHAINRQS